MSFAFLGVIFCLDFGPFFFSPLVPLPHIFHSFIFCTARDTVQIQDCITNPLELSIRLKFNLTRHFIVQITHHSNKNNQLTYIWIYLASNMVSNCSHNSSHRRVCLFMPFAKITSSLLSYPHTGKRQNLHNYIWNMFSKSFVFFIIFLIFFFTYLLKSFLSNWSLKLKIHVTSKIM